MKYAIIVASPLLFCGVAIAGTPSSERGPTTATPTRVAPTAAAPTLTQVQSPTLSQNQRLTSRTGVNVVQSVSDGSGGRNGSVLVAPSISGGSPCTVGGSLGGGSEGILGFIGALWEGEDCKAVRKAALLSNLGHPDGGLEFLCRKDMDVRYAMAHIGSPCKVDETRWREGGWMPEAERKNRR